jgi:hypothetical protein
LRLLLLSELPADRDQKAPGGRDRPRAGWSGLTGFGIYIFVSDKTAITDAVIVLIAGAIFVSLAFIAPVALTWQSISISGVDISFAKDLKETEAKVIASGELSLLNVWNVTQKRLTYYHEIATMQARRSFRNAQVAMSLGFIFLIIFAALSFRATSTTVGIITGALGAISAGFAGYISRTFVRSQETAAMHLRGYFSQPVEFSRYLAVERLVSTLKGLDEKQRNELMASIVKFIVESNLSHPPDTED